MKILDLIISDNKILNAKGDGSWNISHKVDSDFSSISCEIGNRNYYISNTKKFQAELDNNIDIDFEQLELIPLYRNCLLDIVERPRFHTILLKVATEESEIADVVLENCYCITPFITDSGENNNIKTIVFGISVQRSMMDNFAIKVIKLNGEVLVINKDGEHLEQLNEKVKKPKRIQAPRILIIPKKTYIVDDMNQRKDGYFSVHIYDILSRYSKIIENNSNDRDYIASDTVSKDYIKQANSLLKHSIK